ncbi:MAG: Na/Pi cotransporter family protein [Blautia sp.]|nr:Na/Pi cotransporter family protein [Blautia sp.]
MNIFNVLSLLGGLAMFLYGMRMMGDALKESSSGTLKKVMGKVTNTPIKAFFLGLLMTAIIQSSTATIVITSGLVGAGIISVHQSLGIIIGANVGTTVTGQIIRLLDLNGDSTSILQLFKPSTLAPLALIIGIVMIMSGRPKRMKNVGQIAIGFGILFSGLMNMTGAVSTLTETGIVEKLFSGLGENPLIGYLIGAGVAFVLQSSSATIGVLQAFSISGQLTFGAIYAVLVGIYLGDCVTTAIVCNIGAKPDAKRVGVVNILFNLSETVLILTVVNILHKAGLLDSIWSQTINSGGIANTNTVFNLSCALLMLPFVGVYERISSKLVKDEPVAESPYSEKINALNPVFFSTPALAFNACYEILQEMFQLANTNMSRSFDLLVNYNEETADAITLDEGHLDVLTDKVSNYLVQISGHISAPYHLELMNYYYNIITEFERLGDHATNIMEIAADMKQNELCFSETALEELKVCRELIESILSYAGEAFYRCNAAAAQHIEPLEEVVDDLVNALKQNHLDRLRNGRCSILAGIEFLNLLSDVERISDICSNVGVATVARVTPEMRHEVHDYVSMLHSGNNESFNKEYREAHDRYFSLLNAIPTAEAAADGGASQKGM